MINQNYLMILKMLQKKIYVILQIIKIFTAMLKLFKDFLRMSLNHLIIKTKRDLKVSY
jgi:hypothetical protein